MSLTDRDVRNFIQSSFQDNYQTMRLEGGHGLTPDIQKTALEQVLRYWEKLREVAENVTDTEVRLVLPNQKTSSGRGYTIEGVVDIVRENNRTIMYDVKTHESGYVCDNKKLYEKQLNVYAYIWQQLRAQQLDETAIIATALPKALEDAIEAKDEIKIAQEMAAWDPLIPIPFDPSHVADTISEFGKVVDKIEGKQFEPASLDVLREKSAGTNVLFATRVCRNCDARFSCSSYREYASTSKNRKESTFHNLFPAPEDIEREPRIATNVELMPQPTDLD